MIHADTLKALGIFAIGVLLTWRLMTWLAVNEPVPQTAPPPKPPAPIAKDLEVLECDKAVAELLESTDMGRVTRDGIIIQRLNCDIGKRL